ncbi:rhodanese-like domain-containing protein [Longispora sp. NPDC051575]|uniref:rhodanese-like domain-containing protein n=1 Tax=Longispora sp. NPDC051575 TaxID=3154943 RepID=UPI00342CFC0F
MSSITVTAALKLLEVYPDALVVDVRTPGEFDTAHIPGAINLPLDQVDPHLQRIVADAGGTLLLVCQAGTRADACQRKLAAGGLTDTLVVAGGMNAWTATDAPVIRGRARWGLERQVRLLAGGLVATAVLASVWWPPARYLAGLVGAGLAVAALTDTCAMGTALSKLPHNRPSRRVDIAHSLTKLRGATP